jgi:cysteine desulfurase
MQQIYLDHNATTPLRPEVLEAMLPYLRTHFGNPSSVHRTGRRAKQGLEEAREQIAACIRAKPAEVLFTSGGTESNSLALCGAVRAQTRPKTHIITTPVEHSSVLESVQALTREGFSQTLLPVDGEGRIRVDDLAAALRDDTAVVSIGLANSELGTLQPIAACSRLTRQQGVVLHVDAIQATGKLALNMEELGADLVSLSAHKIYGPKGVGALYMRKGTGLVPVLRGGPQEREKRAGTENVAAAVGFGVAAARAEHEREAVSARLIELTTRLWTGIQDSVPGVVRNTPRRQCLPNTLNLGFPGASGEGLMMGLDLAGIAVSTGSACAAGSVEPSHVLLALGHDARAAKSAIRFSLGKDTSQQDIDRVLDVLPGIVERVRAAGQPE